MRSENEAAILPLLLDLANPSPAQGWAQPERLSLEQRGPADAVMALALVHHLAIGRNLPLDRIAAFLSRLDTPSSSSSFRKTTCKCEDCSAVAPTSFRATRWKASRRRSGDFRIESVSPVAGSDRLMSLNPPSRARGSAIEAQ